MNDLISRQAVINLLKQMRKDGDMVPWEGKDVFARIRKLPSAQPEDCDTCKHGYFGDNHCETCRGGFRAIMKGEPMDDLIDRRSAIDALDRIFDRCEEIEAHLPEGDPDRTGYKMYPYYMTVWKYLHQSPSAQPEIIYCKECKFYTEMRQDLNTGICSLACRHLGGDGFCSEAERRTDETTI